MRDITYKLIVNIIFENEMPIDIRLTVGRKNSKIYAYVFLNRKYTIFIFVNIIFLQHKKMKI